MADPRKAVTENVEGAFFVDSTCINCDTCRQLAPTVFRDAGEYSSVCAQPQNDNEEREAFRALLACPTGSIGTRSDNKAKSYFSDFPLRIDDNIYYCGFNSEKSYGANSFFVQHKDGNWLIDSPKYLPYLAKKFEEMGGIKYIFLTHRDDIADADQYAHKFKARRIIHKDDADSQPDCETIIEGKETVQFAPEFKIIPVPGHTRGHMVLIYKDTFLFSGDHLHYDTNRKHLAAYRSVCWYSWPEQIKSMAKLAKHRFQWVLAGHGNRIHLDENEMSKQMNELVEKMKH